MKICDPKSKEIYKDVYDRRQTITNAPAVENDNRRDDPDHGIHIDRAEKSYKHTLIG